MSATPVLGLQVANFVNASPDGRAGSASSDSFSIWSLVEAPSTSNNNNARNGDKTIAAKVPLRAENGSDEQQNSDEDQNIEEFSNLTKLSWAMKIIAVVTGSQHMTLSKL